MKSSASYNRLWRKKLNELPVKEDADLAWSEMNKLLDEHMPEPNSGNGATKIWGVKLVSLLGYILPAAAMIGGITYVSVHVSKFTKAKSKKDSIAHYQLKNNSKKGAAFNTDSLSNKDSSLQRSDDLVVSDSAMGQIAIADTGQPGGKNVDFTGLKKSGRLPSFSGETKVNMQSKRQEKFDPEKNNKKVLISPAKQSDIDNLLKLSTSQSTASRKTEGAKIMDRDFLKPLKLSDSSNVVTGNKEFSTTYEHPDNGNAVTSGQLSTAIMRDKEKMLQARKKPVIKSPQTAKLKPEKIKVRNKNLKPQTDLPALNFGVETGLNLTGGKNLYIGVMGSYSINTKWLINAGLRLDLSRHLSGEHAHRSFNPVDSSAFKVYDSRKVRTLSVPLDIGYRISNNVIIHAGPQFGYILKQTDHLSKLGPIANYRDTLSKSMSIDSAFKHSTLNKLTVGASIGVSLRLGTFYIDGGYLQNITPYRVNTGLGNYQQYYRSFQLGLRYQFKK